jgi:A/G-specific adenine glycosylase
MIENTMTPAAARQLIRWFRKNERDLPWRHTGNLYDVWLSEIMLQQTRVEAVRDRFIAFKQALPDIPALAASEEKELMKLWEGMGYYSRARNLQKCAQVLVKNYQGKLPEDVDSLQALPGIGSYTAGAIASLAYGRPEPAVDGNVLRVLSRLYGLRRDIRDPHLKQDLETMLREFLNTQTAARRKDPQYVSAFNQGLMELGALVCVPNGAPHCELCPWRRICTACRENLTDEIPVRSPKKPRRIEERTILVIRDGSRFLFRRRPAKGLLAGLYELPGLEGRQSREEAVKAAEALGFDVLQVHRLPDSKHIFSHVEWRMQAYEIRVGELSACQVPDCILVSKKELQRFAVPSAFHAYIEYYSLRD